MQTLTLRALATVFVAGALLLAACGDDDSAAETTTTTEAEETTTTTEVEETTTTTEAEETGDWIDFTDPETGVGLRLPGEPVSYTEEVEPEPGNRVTVNAHIVDLGGSAVTFGVYQLSLPAFDLDASVQGSATELGGTVESTSELTYDGRPGLDGVVAFNEPDLGDGVVLVRVVSLAEDRQEAVQISVVGPAGDLDALQALFDEIVESLQV